MFKTFVFVLSILFVFSCGSSSSVKKTTADKQTSQKAKKNQTLHRTTENQVSSDLCKNETCPGYVK